MTGWGYTYPSEKYEFVSWDDEIPNTWKIKNDPNRQPVMFLSVFFLGIYSTKQHEATICNITNQYIFILTSQVMNLNFMVLSWDV